MPDPSPRVAVIGAVREEVRNDSSDGCGTSPRQPEATSPFHRHDLVESPVR